MSLYSRLIRLVMAPASMCPVPVRIWLLNKCPDIAIDSSALIREKVIISVSGVTIKKNAFINRNCFLYSTSPLSSIVIMENAYIGPNSSLICQSHKIGGSNLRAGEDMFGDIVIGEGSWLGANVTVLPNVKIAKGCVVGAGAVVTKSTEPNGLYVGVPARRIKDLVTM